MHTPETKSDVTEVTFEKLVYGGDGLARIDGRVVLAPFVLPGEKARLVIRKEKPGLLEAEVEELLEPAPQRVAAPCPYFGRCGGCAYQHAPYEYQVEQKREILREVLTRVGKFAAPENIETISGPAWEYRNRSQFHVQGRKLGYLMRGSHELCSIDHCPISSPKVNEVLKGLLSMMGDRRFPKFVRSLEVFTNEQDVQINVLETDRPVARAFFDWCREVIPGAGSGPVEYAAAGEHFRVGYKSFFQVNRFLVDRLVEIALDGAEGESAIDLYAGVGLFSLPLARRFRKVTAVESGSSAVRDLEFNAERAGVRIDAEREPAEAFLPTVKTAPDFLLADPPRSGLGKRATAELLRIRPKVLTIVACDPATLARDLAVLLAGGYAIDRMVMVDLFPQTHHLETVVRLRTPE